MSGLLWALPGLPAVAGAALAVTGRRADRVAGASAVAVVGVLVPLAVWAAAVRPAVEVAWLGPLRAGLAVDGLSAVLVAVVVVVSGSVAVFSLADSEVAQAPARFSGLLLLFVAAMLTTVTATSLGVLLVGWELMGAASWALIGFEYAEPDRPPAAASAFLTTRAADLGLYLAAAAAFAGAGTLDLAALPSLSGPASDAVAAGLVVAAAGKSAQLPFSPWLSDAMRGPSPVSALLHSATLVAAGAYLLIRTALALEAAGWPLPVLLAAGAATAVAMGLVALAQDDLKQLLAASTCAQIAFAVMAVGAGAPAAALALLVAHAAYKSALFLAAGAFLDRLGTRDLARLRGAGRRLTATGVVVAVAGAALAGIPPASGWVAKDEVLAAVRAAFTGVWLLGMVAAALAAGYAGKALVVLLGRPRADAERGEAGAGVVAEALPSRLGQAPVAAAALALGVLGLPAVRRALEDATGLAAGAAPGVLELGLSALLAVGGVVAAGALDRAGRLVPLAVPGVPAGAARTLRAWLELPRAADALVIRPVLALATALAAVDGRVIDAGVRGAARVGGLLGRGGARTDDRAVDRLVRGLAGAGLRAADGGHTVEHRVVDRLVGAVAGATDRSGTLSRATDERVVDHGVEGLAALLGRAGRGARRPQTGMVSSYLVQLLAVAAVTATVVLLSVVAG